MRDVELSREKQRVFDRHLKCLALREGIDLRIIPECIVGSYSEIKRVHMIPVRFIEDYAIGLHELGHSALYHRPEQSREWKEILAWKWARKNSCTWNLTMEEHVAYCLSCWGIYDENPAKYVI